MNHCEVSTELKNNTWNASYQFGNKIEMEECKKFLEETFSKTLVSLEHIDYNEDNKKFQQNYGDWKLTLANDKVYWIESKGRARDTTDLCVEVRPNGKGGYNLKHQNTDKLFYWTPNNEPLLIDIPIFREVFYQHEEWQAYCKRNKKGDGYCCYIPFDELIPGLSTLSRTTFIRSIAETPLALSN